MAAVPRGRILALTKTQCNIFSTTFNPDGVRTGNRVLRQRLKGPSLLQWYPRRVWTIRQFQDTFSELGLEFVNEREEDRQEHLEGLKFRGKQAPKKKKGPPVEEKFKRIKKTKSRGFL